MNNIFGDNKIIGLAGSKNSGKTNNLMEALRIFREKNKVTPIYVYGLDSHTLEWVMTLENVFEISSLEQLSNKSNSLFILDEFQRLKLNDRRHKDELDDFIDFIYHKNNWVIFTSPNLREFNSIIGGKIEGWCIKSLRVDSLINGSQLKAAATKYNGRFKSLGRITLGKNEMLVINDEYEKVLEFDYIASIDKKKENVDIFADLKLSVKLTEKRSDVRFYNGSVIRNIASEEKVKGFSECL